MASDPENIKPLLKKGSGRTVDLDDLFPYIGEFGKYQKLLTWFIVLPACIPCGLQGFNQLFMTDDLPHWCHIPDFLVQKTNLSRQQLEILLLPSKDNVTSQCSMRDLNWTALETTRIDSVVASGKNSQLGTTEDQQQWHDGLHEEGVEQVLLQLDTVVPCQFGWEYDTSLVSHSVVKDFDLVCGKEIYPTVALILFNVAGLFGVFFFGLLSDKIGRKLSFFACLSCEMVGGVGCIFASDFWTWTGFRMLTGLTVPAIYQIPFIICLELVGPTYRAFVTVMTCLFYVTGLMLLPLIAYLERDWRLLSLYTTVPFAFYYIFYWFLPESPRWLLAEKRVDEALQILQKLTKVNGNELPMELVDKIRQEGTKKTAVQEEGQQENSSKGIADLFRTPNMRLKTCLLTLCWFAGCTVYVGLSFYGPALGENPYFSFFLGSAIELPGYLLCWLLMDRIGRRWPLSACMIVGGLAAIATTAVPPEQNLVLMTFYLIAKFGISAAYLIIYPFAGELYPTEVRGIGLGFSAYVGGIGLCCIPLINYLGRTNLTLPLFIMGGVSVIGGVAGLRLPETLNTRLPQSLEEGEEFGKDFRWRQCFTLNRSDDSSISPKDTSGPDWEDAEIPKRTTDIPMEPIKGALRKEERMQIIREEHQSDGQFPQDLRQLDDQLVDESTPLRSHGEQPEPPTTTFGETSAGRSHQRKRMMISRGISVTAEPGGSSSSGSGSRRKHLVRQSSSIMEAPTDSKGAIMLTPWW